MLAVAVQVLDHVALVLVDVAALPMPVGPLGQERRHAREPQSAAGPPRASGDDHVRRSGPARRPTDDRDPLGEVELACRRRRSRPRAPSRRSRRATASGSSRPAGCRRPRACPRGSRGRCSGGRRRGAPSGRTGPRRARGGRRGRSAPRLPLAARRCRSAAGRPSQRSSSDHVARRRSRRRARSRAAAPTSVSPDCGPLDRAAASSSSRTPSVSWISRSPPVPAQAQGRIPATSGSPPRSTVTLSGSASTRTSSTPRASPDPAAGEGSHAGSFDALRRKPLRSGEERVERAVKPLHSPEIHRPDTRASPGSVPAG